MSQVVVASAGFNYCPDICVHCVQGHGLLPQEAKVSCPGHHLTMPVVPEGRY